MSTAKVIEKVREAIAAHTGSEEELYGELLSEAEGWKMRLEELEAE